MTDIFYRDTIGSGLVGSLAGLAANQQAKNLDVGAMGIGNLQQQVRNAAAQAMNSAAASQCAVSPGIPERITVLFEQTQILAKEQSAQNFPLCSPMADRLRELSIRVEYAIERTRELQQLIEL